GEEGRLGPGVVAVGVVVGGGLAKVRQRRHHVRGVVAQVIQLSLRIVHLLDQTRECFLGQLGQGWSLQRKRCEVAGPSRVVEEVAQAGQGRDRDVQQRPELGGKGREV